MKQYIVYNLLHKNVRVNFDRCIQIPTNTVSLSKIYMLKFTIITRVNSQICAFILQTQVQWSLSLYYLTYNCVNKYQGGGITLLSPLYMSFQLSVGSQTNYMNIHVGYHQHLQGSPIPKSPRTGIFILIEMGRNMPTMEKLNNAELEAKVWSLQISKNHNKGTNLSRA